MHYTQLFRQFREARGLSLDGLAQRAGWHRNTVINIENGRSVKFRTLADLMEKLGYGKDSQEMRALAMLWLEAVSGIPFSRPEAAAAARRKVAAYRRGPQAAAHQLTEAIAAAALTAEQIRLLGFAVRRPEVLEILRTVRDLVEPAASDDTTLQLKVAEKG